MYVCIIIYWSRSFVHRFSCFRSFAPVIRFAEKIVSELTCIVSGGMLNLTLLNAVIGIYSETSNDKTVSYLW